MGVTVHFEGSLPSADSYSIVIEKAQAFARSHDWPTKLLPEESKTLARVRDEEDWDYTGPTSGIEIQPHENSDPLRLEFDSDFYVQEYCKTQFAPLETHALVIDLLRLIEGEFTALHVEDEGELWITGDMEILADHVEACFRGIDDHLENNPKAYGPVRLGNGRIADLLSGE